MLGDSRGARAHPAPPSTPPARRPRSATGRGACCWRPGSRRRPVSLELAREHVATAARAGRRDRRRRPAGALLLPPRLRRLPPRRVRTRRSSLTDRADALYGASASARGTRPRTGSSPSRAAISAVDHERAVRGPRPGRSTGSRRSTIPWLAVRREAMLGELARIEHRFDDAVLHIGRAASTSRRARFPADRGLPDLEPRARAVPGGRLRRGRGDARAGDREGRGDRRRAPGGARARPPGARACAPSAGRRRRGPRWRRRTPGIGLRAAASRRRSANACSRRSTRPTASPAADERLTAILDDARRRDDAPVEVFALDALGRVAVQAGDAAAARDLCEEADRRMDAASHFIAELDRVDARAVRLMAGSARRAGSGARSRAGR